jgi:CRISPR system Cascade subunit CasC
MTTFIQFHLLTSYPPANLNRDDLGRPKTAVMGGAQRLRISSQSLKRAWRTSALFEEALSGHVGVRTKEIGTKVVESILTGRSLADILWKGDSTEKAPSGISEGNAKKWAWAIASVFVDKAGGGEETEESDEDTENNKGTKGKEPQKKKQKKSNVDRDTLKSEQLVFYSVEEIEAIDKLIKTLIKEKREPRQDELGALLTKHHRTADLALFGRMLAGSPDHNGDAAVQVAHAITVHKVAVEDDYFTAVDDLNKGDQDMGAGHIGETEFAAGLFYLYACIDRDLLVKNLKGDEDLACKTLRALTECAATIAPNGKQNSFASRAYASYILAEKGNRQPRTLSVAFLKPVNGADMLSDAIVALNAARDNIDKVYGKVSEASYALNAVTGQGSLMELLDFASKPLGQKK